MGLTHYWQRETELSLKPFNEAVNDCKKLFENLSISLGNAQGAGEPVFSDTRIEFNGKDGYGCEPFVINRMQYPRPGRKIVTEYCKTENLPYNICVQCALIILQHHLLNAVKIMSDGSDYDWDEARRTCMKYLGYGSSFCLSKESNS